MKENSDTIRKADISDVEEIMSVMDSARDYQRELGFRQWEDGYPNREVIGKDIEGGNAYVMVSDDRIVAYWALIVGDSSYDMLRNVWRHSGPYTVVHRMATDSSFRGNGISAQIFKAFEDETRTMGINIIRIDTGLENKVMLHLLSKYGYENLGAHMFSWGERVAFEKLLQRPSQ